MKIQMTNFNPHNIIEICKRFQVDALYPQPSEKIGIALQTLNLTPLNALRHQPENGTCGWYIWAGELSNEPDFFQALHIEHLPDYAPSLMPYISLPPGWRVLLAHDYEDVWFDEKLLNAES